MRHNMQAFIFDLDGTLLDSLEDIADSANAALTTLGYPTHSVTDYRYFVGNGIEILMRRAAPQNLEDQAIASLHRIMGNHYGENWHNKTRPYDGILQLLSHLLDMNFPLAILSNKPHHLTTKVVQFFFPSVPFVCVQGKPEDRKGKPDPTLALAIAKDMAVSPKHVALMGDTSVDMDTAVAAGMLPLGVLWGFRSGDELLQHGAQITLNHPSELVTFINKQ